MKFILPKSWWKLSFRWLFSPESRGPVAFLLSRGSLRIAIAGLAIGVTAMSLTMAIFSGFQNVISKSVISARGHVVHITPWLFEEQAVSLAERIKNQDIERVQMFWTSQALLVGPKGGRGVRIEGVKDFFPDKTSLLPSVEANKSIQLQVSLGKSLADYLGVQKGDDLKILLPGIITSPVKATVGELLQIGMHDIDSRLVRVRDVDLKYWVKQQKLNSFNDRAGDFHGIRFFLNSRYDGIGSISDLKIWQSRYFTLVKDAFKNPPMIHNWQVFHQNLLGAAAEQKKYVAWIFLLIKLVAALNIAACLVIVFLERDRDMAILQAMGMARKQFITWISLQGLLLGVAAAVVGMLFSFVLSFVIQYSPLGKLPYEIYEVERLPINFLFSEQIVVVVFSMLVATTVAFVLAFALSRMKLLSVLGQRR